MIVLIALYVFAAAAYAWLQIDAHEQAGGEADSDFVECCLVLAILWPVAMPIDACGALLDETEGPST